MSESCELIVYSYLKVPKIMTSKKKTNRTNGIPINVVVLGIIAGVFVLAWFINQAGLGGSLRTAALNGPAVVPEIKFVSSADFLRRDGISPKPTFYKSSLTWATGADHEAARKACVAKVVGFGYAHNARASGIRDPFGNCDSLNDDVAINEWREMTNDVRLSKKRGDNIEHFETENRQYVTCLETKVIAETECCQVVPKPSPSGTAKPTP